MVSENWPTYVVLALYVLATILVTIAANIKNKDPTDSSSHISKHFLASKNFGSLLLTFTTFASVFSGYTVVGVPNEAGTKGFFAVRWMSLIIIIAISMLWLYPRLRRLSMVRGYESPGDFIADRFKNKAISILVALLVCIPQILYIGINLYSLGAVVDDLTNSELGFYPVVIFSTIMILLFEAFGGMRSVAYTDAVEAIVMVIVFITIPIMIAAFTKGGFVGMVNNSDNLTIPCKNSNADSTSGCLNYAVMDGDHDKTTEWYLRGPAASTTANYVLFTLSGVSFALNPHITQRALSAKSDSHVRFVVIAIFIVTFITMTPGILTGIAHISNKPDLKEEYGGLPAFQAMLAVFRDKGGFSAFISYIALLAGIAGIMSTADSALIGVSNTMSVDVFKNWVFQDYSDMRIVYIGKAVSVCTMSLCLAFSIALWETGAEYGVVYTIQQGLLWQAVPAYIFGLYTSVCTNAVLTGTIVGAVVDIILIGCVFGGSDPFPLIDKSWSTLLGVLINIIVSVIAHYSVFRERTGDHPELLSLDKIREIMTGLTEPIAKWYGALIWLTAICVLVSAFHWIDDEDPMLIEAYGEEATHAMLYNGAVRNVIGGMPDYIFATFLWLFVAMMVGIAATMQWTVSDKFPIESTEKSNTNISAVTVSSNGTENDTLKTQNGGYHERVETVELAIDSEI